VSIESSNQKNSEQKVDKRLVKSIQNVLKVHDLDIRDIAITSDGKYLISCSEFLENEKPQVSVWQVEKILEGIIEPDVVLLGDIKENKNVSINNWLLCVDTINLNLGASDWWIVCAGSIIGDIYIWYGKIDKLSKEWILKDYSSKILSHGSENSNDYPKALYDLKLMKDSVQKNAIKLYCALNNIHTIGNAITKDNLLKELILILESSGTISENVSSKVLGTQDEWIIKLDLYIDDNNSFLVSGSREGTIHKWNLGSDTTSNPILIGKHEDSITCVKVSIDGTTIASGSYDNSIRIWKNNNSNNPDLDVDLIGHFKPVTSLEFQKNNKFLVSASKDNTIKIWEIDKGSWTRNIDMDYFIDEDLTINKPLERGGQRLKCLLVSPNNRYIFTTIHNKIFMLRNYGVVWHFSEQLKFIKEIDKTIYSKIFGINLRQIAKNSEDSIESLKKLYEIIKKRLNKATRIELESKTKEIKEDIGEYTSRELGPLFIPSFINFEPDIKFQNEYILGIKENYKAYWHSVKNLIYKLPELPWQFKLYITTDTEEDIEDAKFVEITDPKLKDSAYIIMPDRAQTLVRLLLVLENVPTSFVPLINSINIDIEDDRGDKDTLTFSHFTFSSNFVKILTNPRESLKDFTILRSPESIFYSSCTFQLEEGYCTEDSANLFVRNITPEFEEKLNPLENSFSEEEDIEIFEAIKHNFQYPLIPKIEIQVGKGIASKLGKVIDEYFGKIIITEFIFSFWGFMEIGLPAMGVEIPEIVSNLVSVSGILIILLIFLLMVFKKK